MSMLFDMQFFPKFAKDKYTTILNILRNFLAVIAVAALSCTGFQASAQKDASALKLSTVVIDPGHGGKDAGCISPSGKTMEKTVVLDISLRLAEKIRKGCPDVKVVLTRSTDTFVELQGRADIANSNKANLFISVHVNSVDGKRNGPNGYSVHVLGQYTSRNKDLYAGNMDVVRRENSVIKLEDDYTARYEGFDPSDPESYIFMNLVQNAFLEQSLKFAQLADREMRGGAIKNSRGVHQDPFYVLWKTAMPAVLVECGFMSNSGDRAALITEEGRDRIASDLFDAFRKYKASYEGSGEGTAPSRKEEYPTREGSPETVAGSGAGEGAGQAQEGSAGKDDASGTGSPEDRNSAADGTIYGTQVLVSSRKMPQGDKFFKGYTFKRYSVGKLYKYVIGFSEDPEEAKKENRKIRELFADSFMVKVQNGEIQMWK